MNPQHDERQNGREVAARQQHFSQGTLPHLDQEAFRRAVEWAPGALVMIEADGRIALANVKAEKVFGYDRGELIGQAAAVLVPERLVGSHDAFRDALFADPQPRQLGGGRGYFCKRKNGSEFPAEIGLTHVNGRDGVRVLAAIEDISERKQLEERFRRMVEYSPIAKLMIDRQGSIVLVNAEAERIFGYTRLELIGQSVDLLVPERLRGHHAANRRGFHADSRPRPMGVGRDLFARRADGSEFPVEIGLNPIDTEDGAMVLAAIVDITERRRAQQKIEAALEEKTVLLNEVHHRVKNNLQVISSLLNLQAAGAADERLREALNESLNRVRAMALTHQLLYERKDFSSIDLAEYLRRLTQLLQSAYRSGSQRSIVINLKLEEPTHAIRLDMERSIPCGLVVNELVTNAFKHAFPGGRSGEITVALDGSSADEIVLSVHDDGVGMPPDFKIEQARSLGLQLVPMLVEQLLGRMTLGPGPGVHFTMHFPLMPLAVSPS